MSSETIRTFDDVPETVRGCVLTMGNFDGVHLGHRRIIATAAAIAGSTQTQVVAMTFEPPPDRLVHPDDVPQRISPPDQKCQLLLAAGADMVVIMPTDEALLAMAPKEFVHQLVMRRFAPSCVVEGENFFFGLSRSGNVGTLRSIGDREGFAVQVVDPMRLDLPEGPKRISSTLVRRLIDQGRVEEAQQCLGRPYALYGQVISGQGRGRLLEFPTANIDPGEQIVPADGVYAGWATVGSTSRPAAVSIGRKPTLGPGGRTVEAFVLDVESGERTEFYGQAMTVTFLRRLRDQQKFEDADALRGQIAKDVERVRQICR